MSGKNKNISKVILNFCQQHLLICGGLCGRHMEGFKIRVTKPQYLWLCILCGTKESICNTNFCLHDAIQESTTSLSSRAGSTEPHRESTDYTMIILTWFHSQLWLVEIWSVSERSARTNFHVQGWQRRLNRRAIKEYLPFNSLIPLSYWGILNQWSTRLWEEQ